MIGTHEILAVAQCFAGQDMTQEEMSVLGGLCENAGRFWKEQLREELRPEDCRGAFLTASAWTALADMGAAGMAGGALSGVPLSFRAGDLSVSQGGGREVSACVRSLKNQAQALMAPYVRDRDFAFLEVEG